MNNGNGLSDHDLLIRLDERMERLEKSIDVTNDLQLRVREIETKIKLYAMAISVVTSLAISLILKYLA